MNRRRIFVFGIGAAVVVLLVVFVYRGFRVSPSVEVPASISVPRDTSLQLPPEREPIAEVQPVTPPPATRVPTPPPSRAPLRHRIMVTRSIQADIRVFEFIRDFYRDVTERTVTASFAAARLYTNGGTGWTFHVEGDQRNKARVKRLFVVVDSASSVRKYLFPGWGYGADWVPSPGGKPMFTCRLDRKPGQYDLKAIGTTAGSDEGIGHREIAVRLQSVAGYAYALRLGIECVGDEKGMADTTYYAPLTPVEFPAILGVAELASGSVDTVYIATHNPHAIREVVEIIPNSIVAAVLFTEDSDVEQLREEFSAAPNLRLSVDPVHSLPESFIVLSKSRALVESQWLDPAFVRIVQSYLEFVLREGPVDKNTPERPALHITSLVEDPQRISKLVTVFRQYRASSAKTE
jgi:hypothetical protein